MKRTMFAPASFGPQAGSAHLGAVAMRPMCPGCGVSHAPSARMGQKKPPAPGVCCQLDKAGNTACSDGRVYPPS